MLAYLSLRRNHPGLTAEQVAEVLTLRNLEDVAGAHGCSGMGGIKKKAGETETPPISVGAILSSWAGGRTLSSPDRRDISPQWFAIAEAADSSSGSSGSSLDLHSLTPERAAGMGFKVVTQKPLQQG